MASVDDTPVRAGEVPGEDDPGTWAGVRPSGSARLLIVLAVGCGGVVGALARYGIELALPAPTNGFPWSTLLINVSGSAALGFLLVLLFEEFPEARLTRPVAGAGFLGAYTTFSTYVVEAVVLVKAGHATTAAGYLVGTAVLGLGAAWLGMRGARMAVRTERWLREVG